MNIMSENYSVQNLFADYTTPVENRDKKVL